MEGLLEGPLEGPLGGPLEGSLGGRLEGQLGGPLEGPLGGPVGGRLVGQYHRVFQFWRTLVFHDAQRNQHGMDLLGKDL